MNPKKEDRLVYASFALAFTILFAAAFTSCSNIPLLFYAIMLPVLVENCLDVQHSIHFAVSALSLGPRRHKVCDWIVARWLEENEGRR